MSVCVRIGRMGVQGYQMLVKCACVCIGGMGGRGYQGLVKKVEEEILTHVSKRVASVACES